MVDLEALIENLPSPITSRSDERKYFSAVPIPGYEQHRIGKDTNGLPVILFSIADRMDYETAPPVVLENLSVLHNVNCRVLLSEFEEEGQFSIIQCTSHDSLLQAYFLRVVGALILSLPNSPSYQEVSSVVGNLLKLFRAMKQTPRSTIQGLWGELYLIARTRNPSIIVRSWHSTPEEVYDFSDDNCLVEIKSSGNRSRIHHFSLKQLSPPEGSSLLVASLFVEPSSGGLSIEDLSIRIRKKLSEKPEQLIRFDQIVAQTIGENWRDARDKRFNERLAKQSLAFFDSEAVPSLSDCEIPRQVSSVRFVSDLSSVPQIDKQEFKTMSKFFRTILI